MILKTKLYIDILTVGKIKNKNIQLAIDDYCKMLLKYAKVNIIELKEEKNDNINIIKKKETENIIKRLNNDNYKILLNIEGKMLSSEEFSKKIEKEAVKYGKITLIIGGSNGVDDEIKKYIDYELSFSKMTFPHQLFRLVVLEQIYRALSIINNAPYHK